MSSGVHRTEGHDPICVGPMPLLPDFPGDTQLTVALGGHYSPWPSQVPQPTSLQTYQTIRPTRMNWWLSLHMMHCCTIMKQI